MATNKLKELGLDTSLALLIAREQDLLTMLGRALASDITYRCQLCDSLRQCRAQVERILSLDADERSELGEGT